MFPWFVISVLSVVLAVDGSGRAADESGNITIIIIINRFVRRAMSDRGK